MTHEEKLTLVNRQMHPVFRKKFEKMSKKKEHVGDTESLLEQYIKEDHFDKEFDEVVAKNIGMLVEEKKSILEKNKVYCKERGIFVGKTVWKLMPQEKEGLMNDEDKKVYDELVEAMFFL